TIRVTGEVTFNEYQVAHIVPVVSGIVKTIYKVLGDPVRKNELLAILDSTEFGEAKSEYLKAKKEMEIAKKNYEREKRLFEEARITTETELLEAERIYKKAQAELMVAERRLHFLGLTDEDLSRIESENGAEITQFPIRSPIAGTIVEMHLAKGEFVESTKDIYLIADLSKVWVVADIYEKDLAKVFKAKRAHISVKAYPDREFIGKIFYISDIMDKNSRTIKVYIEVPNQEGLLEPGMFARVEIPVMERRDVLAVPKEAVLSRTNTTIVFVEKKPGEYHRREIITGLKYNGWIEVIDGLREGEVVVTQGNFLLLSELEKSKFEEGH
ncbi:efflux RND transporter periplasmic adaptor subunit, partial [Candidatus Aminicenantes bacterium AC-335-A11]|nr:efflux RND transporter periplasmic adaptor subunit [Candidatus Aminicenantes bacterium AC-335-A11]